MTESLKVWAHGTQHTQFFYGPDGGLVRKTNVKGTPAYLTRGGAITLSQLATWQESARFHLAIDSASGVDAPVVRLEVIDLNATDGITTIAKKDVLRSQLIGGIAAFADVTLVYDGSQRGGHQVEYRVWWYGNAQIAHDRTTDYMWEGAVTHLDSYGYDAAQNGIGRRISMSNSSASAAWSYDQYGRLITDTRTITAGGLSPVYTTTFAYDRLDRVLTTTYPSGEAVGMTYDAVGQPISLTGLSNYVTNATYNVLGLPTRIDFGNGLGARYTYFGLEWLAQGNPLLSYGRLRQACVIAQTAADCPDAGTPDALLNMAYAYDSVGNITNIGDRALGAHHLFGYDALNRLVSVAQSYTQAYAYDVLGNVTSKPIVSGTGTVDVAYTYGVTQPHAVRSLSNGALFQYDANGNMTQRVEVSGTQRITYTQGWDIDNRLVAITSTLGTTTTFTYDANVQRVTRSDISGTTAYIGQYYEVQLSTGITTSYYTFGAQRVAMRTGSSVRVAWLHGDHLGSASLTTDINGSVVSEMRYYPFGEVRWQNGTMPTDHTFTGQRADGSLMDYGARFYSPILGRFISADSIVPQPGDPQSLNRFSYVRNSPLVHVDPSGHSDGCNPALYNCGPVYTPSYQQFWTDPVIAPQYSTPETYGPIVPASFLPDPAAHWQGGNSPNSSQLPALSQIMRFVGFKSSQTIYEKGTGYWNREDTMSLGYADYKIRMELGFSLSGKDALVRMQNNAVSSGNVKVSATGIEIKAWQNKQTLGSDTTMQSSIGIGMQTPELAGYSSVYTADSTVSSKLNGLLVDESFKVSVIQNTRPYVLAIPIIASGVVILMVYGQSQIAQQVCIAARLC